MNLFVSIVCTVASVEIFRLSPLAETVGRFRILVGKITDTIGHPKVSDHWKEQVLLKYAQLLFMNSISLSVYLFLSLSPFVLASALSIYLDLRLHTIYTSVAGIAGITVVALAYAKLRHRND